jgi:hypothetical protein
MATHDGSGEKPAANGPEQRPGSYVQVLAPRRKRGTKPESGASGSPSAASASESAVEQPLSVRGRDAEERRGSGPAVARRAMGPLGMDEGRSSEQEPASEPKRGSAPAQPRVKVVEINPELEPEAVEASVVAVRPLLIGTGGVDAQRPMERAPSEHDDGWDAAMAVARTAVDSEPPRSRPPSLQHLDPDPWRAYQAAIVQPSTRPSAAPEQLARISSEELRAALSRPAIPSVLDARPTLEPSPLPPSDKPTLGWWLLVGALSSVIAAAGYLAIGQLLRAERASHDVPVVEELAPQTKPVPPADPAPNEGASVIAPASTSAPSAAAAPVTVDVNTQPAAAASVATVAKREAPIAVARPISAVRTPPAKRAGAESVVSQPSSAPAAPGETLPSNPYED